MNKPITEELHPGPVLDKELAVSAASIRGARQYQEDSLLYEPVNGGMLGAVLDGMGGMEYGKEASQSAAKALADWFEEHPFEDLPDERYWEEALGFLDQTVSEIGKETESITGCGTTVTAAYLKNGKMTWASVGDSMIFLIRDGHLMELTEKHNYRMILDRERREGEITPEEYASELGQAKELVSYIGMNGLKFADVSRKEIPLQNSDIILICTDGLYKELEPEEILSVTETLSGELFYQSTAFLIKTVLNKTNRKPDNISVVSFQYQKGA